MVQAIKKNTLKCLHHTKSIEKITSLQAPNPTLFTADILKRYALPGSKFILRFFDRSGILSEFKLGHKVAFQSL